MKFTLTEPTPFLTLELSGLRTQRQGQGEANWHLVQGIFVVNAANMQIEAYRISSSGMVARRAIVRPEGEDVVNQGIAGVDVPYFHDAARLRDGLPVGTYYTIAFGSDGDRALPNEWWSAGVQLEGAHSCAPVGAGEVFDHDLTDFKGGTMAYANGVGYARDTAFSFDSGRPVVIGLMEADSQIRAASHITLDYQTPTTSGTVEERIVPFISTAGTFSYTANFEGYYPKVAIAGVTATLP